MPLSDHEKTEARDAIALALELNEPETMIEGLQRLCGRKLAERHISDNERERWSNAHNALASVASELERANAPTARDIGQESAPSAPGDTQSDY